MKEDNFKVSHEFGIRGHICFELTCDSEISEVSEVALICKQLFPLISDVERVRIEIDVPLPMDQWTKPTRTWTHGCSYSLYLMVRKSWNWTAFVGRTKCMNLLTWGTSCFQHCASSGLAAALTCKYHTSQSRSSPSVNSLVDPSL
jgi:hypothetical protein